MSVSLNVTYFLSLQVWEKYGQTGTNIDPKKLKPIIYSVQRNRIEPVLGSQLYKKLIEDVDGDSLSGIYETLMLEHILPTMIAYCDWKAVLHTTMQITNKVTGEASDEHIRANDRARNNELRDELLKDATALEVKMIGFLKDNFQDIPELYQVDPETIHEDVRPAKEGPTYNGGFIIV